MSMLWHRHSSMRPTGLYKGFCLIFQQQHVEKLKGYQMWTLQILMIGLTEKVSSLEIMQLNQYYFWINVK